MALTAHYYTKFEPGRFYHVYNRSVDKMAMFKTDDNYRFFLKQYDHYMSGVVNTYAYCLLGNHFHLLVQAKDLPGEEASDLERIKKPTGIAADTTHKTVSHHFRKLFQSYAMAFNKQQNRIGTLFQTPVKRALVDTDEYYTHLVYYIHANPQKHGLINDFRDWKWSSYSSMLTDKPTKLKKQEVITWFGNENNYLAYHRENQNIIASLKYVMED